jgi:hypothetical protein
LVLEHCFQRAISGVLKNEPAVHDDLRAAAIAADCGAEVVDGGLAIANDQMALVGSIFVAQGACEQ